MISATYKVNTLACLTLSKSKNLTKILNSKIIKSNQCRHFVVSNQKHQRKRVGNSIHNPKQTTILSRKLSDKPPSGGDKSSSSSKQQIPDEERTDIVLTPGEKVVAGTRLTMYLAMAGAAITCLYFTARELIPTKMSPNTVFNNAHAIIQNHPDVTYRFGNPIKSYGKDHGGKREGRRNFIEHSTYTDKDDGSNRVRVRFNLEGPQGNAFVFAEVSSDMPSGEFVYLLVQDKRNGRVVNVIDNRSMLAAKRMAAGSKEGEEAFANLLGGGRN